MELDRISNLNKRKPMVSRSLTIILRFPQIFINVTTGKALEKKFQVCHSIGHRIPSTSPMLNY